MLIIITGDRRIFNFVPINKIINTIWNEFVYGGHLLSLGAAGTVFSVMIILEKWPDWQVLLMAYLISQIVYVYNHFEEADKDLVTNPERVRYLQKFAKYYRPLLLFYIILLLPVLVLFANLQTLLFALFLLAGGVLFTIFFKGLTKKIIGFKEFYVALFWAAGVFLPPFYYSFHLNLFFISFFLYIFLRSYLHTTFCDIKDTESDKSAGLKTAPVIFGQKRTLAYLHLVNFLSMVLLVGGYFLGIFPTFSLFLIVFYFYSFYYLREAGSGHIQKIRSTSYFLVDSEDVLCPMVLIAGKMFLY